MNNQRAGRPVVAGVDGSESALRAVRWAALEAARRRAPLRLVAAVPSASATAQFAYSGTGPDPRDVLLRQARTHLAHAAQAAVDAAPGTAPAQEVLDGFPIPRLIEEARSAQLVALGDRGLGGVTGLLVGSVAFALAAQGACPVVVVRGRTEAADGPVIIGVDGSPVSEAALAFAFESAAMRRAPLLAVHVWWDLLLDPVTLPSLDWDAMAERERAELAERLAGWGEKYPDVAVERLVARDHPARVLAEQSERAQLLVVGSRGRGGVSGLVLGSVSHAVLHRSACPVAAVRADLGSGPR
jgi:nucleotide-binding universal stress UspA family protein